MKKLLCLFNYNGFLYEVFIDSNNAISVLKIGHQKEESPIKDYEIIQTIINKISSLKYMFFSQIEYNNEKLKLYYNTFNNKVYISKLEGINEIPCSYENYKALYDKYNNPILYDFLDKNNENKDPLQFIIPDSLEFLNVESMFSPFRKNNSRNTSRSSGSWETPSQSTNPWGTPSQSSNSWGSSSQSNDFWDSPTQSNDPFRASSPSSSSWSSPSQSSSSWGSTSQSNDPWDSSSWGQPSNNTPKKKKSPFKIIKIAISGVLITAVLATSAILTHHFKNIEIDPNNPEALPTETIEISATPTPAQELEPVETLIPNIDSVLFHEETMKQIRETLKDEEPWVVEKAIQAYKNAIKQQLILRERLDPNALDPYDDPLEPDPIISTPNNSALSTRVQKVLEAIRSNPNISNENKEFFVNVCSSFFSDKKYLEFLSDDEFDEYCEKIASFTIHNNAQRNPNESELLAGTYNPNTNEIRTFGENTSNKTLAHEFIHTLSSCYDTPRTALREGYTELYNPYNSSNPSFIYQLHQTLNIMCEQIYGKEKWEEILFSNTMFDTFGEITNNPVYTLICHLNDFAHSFQDSYMESNPGITQKEFLKLDEQKLNKMKELLDEMTEEYKRMHNGKSWDDNEVYKLCYDMLTGEHTSDRHPGDDTEISYIFRGKDGRYVAGIEKTDFSLSFSDPLFQGMVQFTPKRIFYIDDNTDYVNDNPEAVEHEDDER